MSTDHLGPSGGTGARPANTFLPRAMSAEPQLAADGSSRSDARSQVDARSQARTEAPATIPPAQAPNNSARPSAASAARDGGPFPPSMRPSARVSVTKDSQGAKTDADGAGAPRIRPSNLPPPPPLARAGGGVRAAAAAGATGGVGGSDAAAGPETVGQAATTPPPPPAGPRRVRLALTRIDPWSALKISFLLSVAIGIGIVVATAVFWYLLDGIGLFTAINDQVVAIGGEESDLDILQYVEFGRVISLATIIAVADVVLLTALATLGAFIYNITAALVGGVHVTLTDD